MYIFLQDRTCECLYIKALAALLALFFIIQDNAIADAPTSKIDISNLEQVDRGNKVYQRFCSLCHGKRLQGQANWRKIKKDGKFPAPPHDSSGHTWHHPDDYLFSVIKYGLVPPYAPPNYNSDMPAWKDTLSDEDIWAVLTFIKSQWPKEIREQQEARNQPSIPPDP